MKTNLTIIKALLCVSAGTALAQFPANPRVDLNRALNGVYSATRYLRQNDVYSAEDNLNYSQRILSYYNYDRSIDWAERDIEQALYNLQDRRMMYRDRILSAYRNLNNAASNIQYSPLYYYRDSGDVGSHEHGEDNNSCKWYTLDGGFSVPGRGEKRAVKGCANNSGSDRFYIHDYKISADRGVSCRASKTDGGKNLLINCRNSNRRDQRMESVELYCCTSR
jgi:hypothetical protein